MFRKHQNRQICMDLMAINAIEQRFPRNKGFIVCRTKVDDNDVACHKTSEIVKLKMRVLQHL